MPISVHNIYCFYEFESSNTKYEERGEVDIERLTMEQYLTLDRRDTSRGVRRLETGRNVDFQIKYSHGSILGLTITKALVSIQEMADHSHKWYEEESNKGIGEYKSNQMNIITDKLKNLICDMQNLKENVHTIKGSKRRIIEEQENGERLLKSLEKEAVNTPLVNTIRKTPDYTKCLQELVAEKKKIKEVSVILQNELPPTEKDPRSFILPCVIGNTTVSNSLAYLGSSISVMPFSMFKRLGLCSPKPISTVIEMAYRSIQSPKGIVENVMVKIDKFIFHVDFVMLDIMEDNKVPIILGRPMLATAHAMIDVLVPDDFRENLEEFLMNDNINRDLGDFLEDNDLLPGIDMDSFGVLSDSNNEMRSGLDDLGERIEDFWDAQDPVIIPNKETNPPLRPQFLRIRNRIHQQNPYNLQITCKIGFVNFNPYIDPISHVNVMSRACYNKVMSQELDYT
ncbi:retrovirus-related pol polyprotein from transposon TNT 1-94 [Tanacetum coccineum]